MSRCRRCLLAEAGEQVTYDELTAYLATLPPTTLTDEETYQKRITECINCDCLISGMCLKCGCYVEVRARLKEADCPNINEQRW
ncbi:MAG: hypothetical protein IJ168_10945 [Eubacterium sp.]|nr:hypothetical protein [Eubacterium sp.]